MGEESQGLTGLRRKSALLEEANQELKRVKERRDLVSTLAERGGGLLLRGWRRELDPDGSMDVSIKELDWHLRRLGLLDLTAKNVVGLKEDGMLTLEELCPTDGELVNRIRDWIKDVWGSPADLWRALDVKQLGNLDREGWISACVANGFDGTAPELSYLFDFIDIDESGQVNKEEILFLETDSEARDKAIFEEKIKSRGQVQRLWASVYWSEQHKELSSLNRPWMAKFFESLPPLVIVQRQRRLREVRRRQRRAKAVFLQKCREKFGSCARAWRRGIDPEGKFYVDKLTLRHFCRGQEIDKHVDLQSLWTTLDSDKDGRIGVQDISPLGAVALASFRAWCRQISGSCRAVWNLPELVDARSSPQKEGSVTVLLNSERKILLRKFVECLKALGWKCSGDQAEMLSALDYFNVGFISEADLYWLDTWEPPLFLTAQASEEAWNEIREILLEIYGTPLNAWRHLDIDGQNEVSWAEFVSGCRRVRFRGDTGGAWRFIDSDASGYISMEEFSPDHYNVLMSFKEWASGLYGSVGNAFKNFDKEGDGILTLSILRRACQKGKWGGDPQMLFDCLEPSSSKDPKQITVEDVSFLDLWPDREDGQDPNEDVDVLDSEEAPSEETEERHPTSAKACKAFKTPKIAPSVFERLYRVPVRRSASAPALKKEDVAMKPEQKAKQIQRTYHHSSLWRQRRQPKTAKSKLPLLEKLQKISAKYGEIEISSTHGLKN
ncbi:unnamed protein product [Durusdinium trenchii]|uniref:Uncharacterized protein n=2 Tax=Durusdinium trenchii TaxID=1381693 RepID=A0ABP0N467_9DINO